MSIPTTIKGVVDVLRDRDTLVDDISGEAETAAGELKKLVTRLSAARRETEDLLDKLTTVQFAVAANPTIKAEQQSLLEKISDVSKDIQTFKAYPQITRHLYAQRTELYLLLANTFNDIARNIVAFTDQDVDELRTLLRRAALDAESRKQKAHLLDAAVQLAKIAFRVAAKLAAA